MLIPFIYSRQYLNEEESRKFEEKERKKAEVRARLELATRLQKGKRGFMTPERKKKLKQFLRENVIKELNIEQEHKRQERRKIIAQRTGQKRSTDGMTDAELRDLCRQYYQRIAGLEDIKYDLEYEVRQKDFVVNELSIEVNDLRGKFVKPALKKVSKYAQKLEKMAKVAAKVETDYRTNLKRVQSQKYSIGDEKQSRPVVWMKNKENNNNKETKSRNNSEKDDSLLSSSMTMKTTITNTTGADIDENDEEVEEEVIDLVDNNDDEEEEDDEEEDDD
ncbi:troponin I-like [Oppia nitens]|uniref:troponin I-like n=1 Tax=Oppia nitens TaxID=1686743 RepID=UPI0023D97EAB|nr:troponin I-like [Oppia nitens]